MIFHNTFSEACYDRNSLDELRQALTEEPDATDMETWGIDADEWRRSIAAALLERLTDEDANRRQPMTVAELLERLQCAIAAGMEPGSYLTICADEDVYPLEISTAGGQVRLLVARRCTKCHGTGRTLAPRGDRLGPREVNCATCHGYRYEEV